MNRKEEYSLITLNSKIVDDFVNGNSRIPTQSEFTKLGGNIEFVKKHYVSFRKFCDELGYSSLSSSKAQEFYLVDIGRNNKVIDHDTMRALQGKYFPDMKVDFLRQYARKNVKIRWRYRIVKELSDL